VPAWQAAAAQTVWASGAEQHAGMSGAAHCKLCRVCGCPLPPWHGAALSAGCCPGDCLAIMTAVESLHHAVHLDLRHSS
jgi:hypothetical protein